MLRVELRCIRELLEGSARPWVDLGTGSGRFGGALGAEIGIDPAPAPLEIAARRIPTVVRAAAGALPLRDASAGAVVAVTVFEFLPDPASAMREVARSLRPGGRLVIGFLQRGSAWAAAYEERGRDPASSFHGARFFSLAEMRALAAEAGLHTDGVRSALFESPGAVASERIEDGAASAAGFVALQSIRS